MNASSFSADASRYDVPNEQLRPAVGSHPHLDGTMRHIMNAARQRRRRGPSAIEFNLDLWTQAVKALEETFRSGKPHYRDLPCCDPLPIGAAARDRLEAIIRRGGRQGHRLAVTVRDLDDRFEAASADRAYFDMGRPWWHRRGHIDELM